MNGAICRMTLICGDPDVTDVSPAADGNVYQAPLLESWVQPGCLVIAGLQEQSVCDSQVVLSIRPFD